MDNQNNLEREINKYLENCEFEKNLKLEDFLILEVNIDEIKKHSEYLYDFFLNFPTVCLNLFEKLAFKKYNEIAHNNVQYKKIKIQINGYLGKYSVSPRDLKSNLINKFVSVNGIVSSARITKKKLTKSVHKDIKNKWITREHRDQYSLDPELNNANLGYGMSMYDDNDKPLTTEFGLCEFYDIQTIILQELPENIPSGLLSRSIEIILRDDLVEKIRPGDRVIIHGILKTKNTFSTTFSGIFRTFILANNIEIFSVSKVSQSSIKDIEQIKNISKLDNLFELLVKSTAPSIEGNNHLKFSILLQLVGGSEKLLNNGTKLRGDIHILLIGDPSTAKSQLLRRVLNLSPISISTNGRGSTGVGLTAIVNTDPDSKERILEAGTLVLADRGIVCIDEFDKMNEVDKVQMHEAMEQQTITINKANIHTTLNTRCSILAAANPLYGEYMEHLSPELNISMQPSLLSRFDLIFIVLDIKDSEKDKMIARKVTYNHQIGRSREFIFKGTSNENYYKKSENNMNKIFEYYGNENQNYEILNQDFLEKYISYCKYNINTALSDDASNYLITKWKYLRLKDSEYINNKNKTFKRTMPITIRSFESLIRISTAIAKLRLSKVIEVEDCELGFFIFLKSYCNDSEVLNIDETLMEKYYFLIEDNYSGNKNKRNNNQNAKKDNNMEEDIKKKDIKADIIKDEDVKLAETLSDVSINNVFVSLVSFKKKIKDDKIIVDDFLIFLNETYKLNKEQLLFLLNKLELKDKIMFIEKTESLIVL